MEKVSTDTTHQPNPCQTAHNERRRDNTRPSSPAVLNAEAVKSAIMEALGYG